MDIATIGFTKSSAESFFERIRASGAKRVLDIRLHNTSQLAGFAKKEDLPYFLERLCGVEYVEVPEMAPEPEMVKNYRGNVIGWEEFAAEYRALLARRKVDTTLDRRLFDGGAILLCSEAKAEHCHRRFAAEYLKEHWGGVTIRHL